jgi:hypothetical protein
MVYQARQRRTKWNVESGFDEDINAGKKKK